MYNSFFKRPLDFCVAFIGFIVLFPILLVITLLLAIVNKGKPFIFQTRPGQYEKLFKIIKFKTMNDNTDSGGNLLSDEKRVTTIGNFVRKTSIDELPQLINVIKGTMSLIGPRPLLPEYLSLYSKEQKKRHLVRPGITGWAQVNGRNAISWEEKFKLDVYYSNNSSFLLDLKIIFLTFKKVLLREGISVKGSISMGKFKGN